MTARAPAVFLPGDAGRYAAEARDALGRGDRALASLVARAAGGAAGREGLPETANPFHPSAEADLHGLWMLHRGIGLKALREIRAAGQADLFTHGKEASHP